MVFGLLEMLVKVRSLFFSVSSEAASMEREAGEKWIVLPRRMECAKA